MVVNVNIRADKKHMWDSGISRQKNRSRFQILIIETVFPTNLKRVSSQEITRTERELDVSFTKAPLGKIHLYPTRCEEQIPL